MKKSSFHTTIIKNLEPRASSVNSMTAIRGIPAENLLEGFEALDELVKDRKVIRDTSNPMYPTYSLRRTLILKGEPI